MTIETTYDHYHPRTPPPVQPYAKSEIPLGWRVAIIFAIAFFAATLITIALTYKRPPEDLNFYTPKTDVPQIVIDHDDGWSTVIFCPDGRGIIDCDHDQLVTYQGRQ